jgi:ABC-type iron transport system FetAB permease component
MIQFFFFSPVAINFSSGLLLVSDIFVNSFSTAINLILNAYIALCLAFYLVLNNFLKTILAVSFPRTNNAHLWADLLINKNMS